MTSWQISPGAERVELEDGKAEVVFTVTNPGPVDKRATVEVVGSELTQNSWFTVAQPQQVIPHGGSTQVAVTVKPGDKAPAGTHWLSTRVYSADAAPEEDSVTSDRVTFEIDAAPKKPNPKWGLWASIAAALVVVVCVVLFLVLRSSGPEMIAVPRVTEMPQSEAEQLIKNAGLLSDDVQKFVYGATVGNVVSQAPAPETPVAKGSPVTITVAAAPKFVPMPPVIGISYEDADAKIRALGLIPIEFRLDHNTAAKNIVFNSDPLPDKPVLEGNKVSVYVSTGNPIRH